MADEQHLSVRVPPEMETGVYADMAAVWHNQHGFTLDFLVQGMVQDDENGRRVVPGTLCARIKVPPGVIFEIARVIAENVQRYEDAFGAITPPPGDS